MSDTPQSGTTGFRAIYGQTNSAADGRVTSTTAEIPEFLAVDNNQMMQQVCETGAACPETTDLPTRGRRYAEAVTPTTLDAKPRRAVMESHVAWQMAAEIERLRAALREIDRRDTYNANSFSPFAAIARNALDGSVSDAD